MPNADDYEPLINPAADLEFVGSICAPFHWVLRDREGRTKHKNGTVSFVSTGTKVVAVTACHVVDACLADGETPEFVQCMIAGQPNPLYFKLKDRLLDRNAAMDLATLSFDESEVTKIGWSVLHG
jgi:hypothetical protein